jgi:hypothetical protein
MEHQCYVRSGPYIVCIDYVHGVMWSKTEEKDVPYRIYITYNDKSTVVLDMTSKEQCDTTFESISEYLIPL